MSKRVLLIGGHGGLSGVPAHLRHLCKALRGRADITVMHDVDQGGYGFAPRSRVQKGLATSLRPLAVWRAWRAVRHAVCGQEYDVVWAHARLPVLLVRMGLRRPAARLVLTYHGLPFEPGQRAWAAWISLWLEAGLLRLSRPLTLVVLSQGAKTRLRTFLPKSVSKHRIIVLSNSSDLQVLPPVPRVAGRFDVLMTGRLSWQKNLPAALAIKHHLPPRAQVVMCGAGTQALGGLGPQSDVAPLLAQSDMYLLTSRYEGVPIGALEAFAAGVPVAMPSGTSDLLARHPMSVRIDPDDPVGAAQAITELWAQWDADPDAARARIQAAWTNAYGFEAWSVQARAVFDGL